MTYGTPTASSVSATIIVTAIRLGSISLPLEKEMDRRHKPPAPAPAASRPAGDDGGLVCERGNAGAGRPGRGFVRTRPFPPSKPSCARPASAADAQPANVPRRGAYQATMSSSYHRLPSRVQPPTGVRTPLLCNSRPPLSNRYWPGWRRNRSSQDMLAQAGQYEPQDADVNRPAAVQQRIAAGEIAAQAEL